MGVEIFSFPSSITTTYSLSSLFLPLHLSVPSILLLSDMVIIFYVERLSLAPSPLLKFLFIPKVKIYTLYTYTSIFKCFYFKSRFPNWYLLIQCPSTSDMLIFCIFIFRMWHILNWLHILVSSFVYIVFFMLKHIGNYYVLNAI